jgi:hypothetical protein
VVDRPLARAAVVPVAGIDQRAVELVDSGVVVGGKGDVKVGRRLPGDDREGRGSSDELGSPRGFALNLNPPNGATSS